MGLFRLDGVVLAALCLLMTAWLFKRLHAARYRIEELQRNGLVSPIDGALVPVLY